MRRSVRNGVLLGITPALFMVLATAAWMTGEPNHHHVHYLNQAFFAAMVAVLPCLILVTISRHLDVEGVFKKSLMETGLAITVFLLIICLWYFPALNIMSDLKYQRGR